MELLLHIVARAGLTALIPDRANSESTPSIFIKIVLHGLERIRMIFDFLAHFANSLRSKEHSLSRAGGIRTHDMEDMSLLS